MTHGRLEPASLEEVEELIELHMEECAICSKTHFDEDTWRWLCITGKKLLELRIKFEGNPRSKYHRMSSDEVEPEN